MEHCCEVCICIYIQPLVLREISTGTIARQSDKKGYLISVAKDQCSCLLVPVWGPVHHYTPP